jgi:membrane associated rhomboid family serine protease
LTQHSDPRASGAPLINIPPATLALLLANVAVHLIRMTLPENLDDAVIASFAFIPTRFSGAGPFDWTAIVTPVTYQFLHGSWAHLGINMIALVAFGAGVEQALGAWRMLAFSLVCGIAAAAVHFAVYPTQAIPIIGASGAISGLFGGVLRTRLALGARGLWPLAVLWIAVDVIGGQMGAPGEPDQPIAWVAHIGGFLAGLALVRLFQPAPGRGPRQP